MSLTRSIFAAFAVAVTLAGFAGAASAQCTISGPTRVCPGDSIQLCSDAGTMFQWTMPDGSMQSTKCITVSQPGVYSVFAFDFMNGISCTMTTTITQSPPESCTVAVTPPVPSPPGDTTNCPRPAEFWIEQVSGRGHAAFSPAELTALAACVDARSNLFSWPDTLAGLRGALHGRDPDAWRTSAVRQYAAALANLCARDLQLAVNGAPIGLDPAAAFASVRGGGTVGGWASATDGELAAMRGASPRDRATNGAYRRIFTEGWRLVHGIGLQTTCPSSATRGTDDDHVELAAAVAAIDAEAAADAASPSPNPFHDVTRLVVDVAAPEGAAGEVAVFDVSGRRLATLARGPFAPGPLAVAWDGRDASGAQARAGVYFVRVRLGGRETSRSVLLVR